MLIERHALEFEVSALATRPTTHWPIQGAWSSSFTVAIYFKIPAQNTLGTN
jgi:hypothetical protein